MNAYDFHRSIDFLILQATGKILKVKSLEKSKYYFDSDFLNDSGIINLLRKTYLEEGNFEKIFNQYQDSRLEPKSYRYESLIAVLIIAIVGNFISGILLDVYGTNREKIIKFFDEKILKSIKMIPEKIQKKFIKGNVDNTKEDFKNLINCYLARLMLERQLIDLVAYYKLVDFYIHGKEIDAELTQIFDQFIEKYSLEKDAIKVDNLYGMIEAYSKGVFLKYLDEKDCNILYFDNIKTMNRIQGISASPYGARKGKIVKGIDSKSLLFGNSDSNIILCIGERNWSPEHLKILRDCHAVVTWGTGMTGHLPFICRGWRRPCVIINESEVNLLMDNDDIIVDGDSGIVYTGAWVKTD